MIDTHTHISKEYYEDISDVIQRAKSVGVSPLIISGCDKSSIEEACSLLPLYDGLYATLGYHPEEALKVTKEDLEELEQIILSNNKHIINL